MTRRTRLRPDARRAQLIELGVQLLATRRLDELSVELIARTAGISRGLLFHYFPSKQEFHLAVARAAAAEMLRRTAPDPARAPVDALRAALSSFIAYVEENPDNYKSLVRGAAGGDARMRTIFDETRGAMAQRILDVLAGQDLEVNAGVELAIHGWVAYVEECVVRWLDTRTLDRDPLLDMLTKSLPAVAATAANRDADGPASIVAADQAIGSK